VSYSPERTEKKCLNCGTIVAGRYCQNCGQENVVRRESFAKLVLHFFYDITHFDGKFFYTLRYLLFRPGFLSKEFCEGRRMKYLNPVRMYVFTSTIFFLVFFLIVTPETFNTSLSVDQAYTPQERKDLIEEFQKEYQQGEDTAGLLKKIALLKDSSHPLTRRQLMSDSAHAKPTKDKQNSGWLQNLLVRRFKLDQNFPEASRQATYEFLNLFLHKLPYLLFLSLPLFALILKLLYIRRKQFFYFDHTIFSIHHYVVSFMILLVCFLFGRLYGVSGWSFLKYLLWAMLLVLPVHLFSAMLTFYRQNWFKTTIKFLLLNMLGFISLVILFILFFFITLLFP